LFAQKHNCPVPDIYWTGKYATDIPFKTLPANYVVKPIFDSGGCSNVYIMVDGFDRMREKRYSTDELANELHQNMAWSSTRRRRRPLMVQEYISSTHLEKRIALEYKLYMFADQLAAIQVIDRASGNRQKMNYYTPEWELLTEQVHSGQNNQDVFREPAECLPQIISCARSMGAAVGTYVRLDFVLGDDGFAFGEMTFTPGGLKSYTPFGDKYFGKYWEQFCPEMF
jgi:hypothetical protein